jgi:hypothetical protein
LQSGFETVIGSLAEWRDHPDIGLGVAERETDLLAGFDGDAADDGSAVRGEF